MGQVMFYSGLLLAGIACSQVFDLDSMRSVITMVTMSCLAYIMIEVGLEFTLDKKRLKSYGWDYTVAMIAAAFPWILCSVYFIAVFHTSWQEAFLVGRFAAPTSAGVLFAMLAAAGLGATWLFKKVRILAIFDDLDTILLLIPLQMMYIGMKPELFAVVALIGVLLAVAYRWLHVFRLPVGKKWLVLYAVAVVAACRAVEHAVHVHLEVLLPAFVLGCVLYNPHDPGNPKEHAHEHAFIEPEAGWALWMDRGIKASFMFLVGCSLPKIDLGGISVLSAAGHVVLLTVLSNVGKCFPMLCYRKEATFKERVAVSIAMFPRGEVGAAVLFVALGYGIKGLPVTIAGMSLALNLLLTGVFIAAVIALISPGKEGKSSQRLL